MYIFFMVNLNLFNFFLYFHSFFYYLIKKYVFQSIHEVLFSI